MSKGYFTDKNAKPDDSGIGNILGEARRPWMVLTGHLTEELKMKGEYKFYGVNYGWALRFSKSGKSIIALYPGKEGFMVQIILNKNQVEAALSQVTGHKLLQLVRDTESIHEGKWIYFPVEATTALQDVFTLVDIRLKVK